MVSWQLFVSLHQLMVRNWSRVLVWSCRKLWARSMSSRWSCSVSPTTFPWQPGKLLQSVSVGHDLTDRFISETKQQLPVLKSQFLETYPSQLSYLSQLTLSHPQQNEKSELEMSLKCSSSWTQKGRRTIYWVKGNYLLEWLLTNWRRWVKVVERGLS